MNNDVLNLDAQQIHLSSQKQNSRIKTFSSKIIMLKCIQKSTTIGQILKALYKSQV